MEEDTSKVRGSLRYIHHFIMFLKDASVENTDRFLNVYVLTNENDQVSKFYLKILELIRFMEHLTKIL